jgi:hypothetical protein
MVNSLTATFGQPQNGKLDFNNATEESLSSRLRVSCRSGVALAEPQLQQLARMLAFRNTPPRSGVISSLINFRLYQVLMLISLPFSNRNAISRHSRSGRWKWWARKVAGVSAKAVQGSRWRWPGCWRISGSDSNGSTAGAVIACFHDTYYHDRNVLAVQQESR